MGDNERVGEAAFAFRHADGALLGAENIEEVRRRCPVLGQMSLEQAELMLELVAMGNEILYEDTVSEKEVPESEKPAPKEIVFSKPEKDPKKAPEILVPVVSQPIAPLSIIATPVSVPKESIFAAPLQDILWQQAAQNESAKIVEAVSSSVIEQTNAIVSAVVAEVRIPSVKILPPMVGGTVLPKAIASLPEAPAAAEVMKAPARVALSTESLVQKPNRTENAKKDAVVLRIDTKLKKHRPPEAIVAKAAKAIPQITKDISTNFETKLSAEPVQEIMQAAEPVTTEAPEIIAKKSEIYLTEDAISQAINPEPLVLQEAPEAQAADDVLFQQDTMTQLVTAVEVLHSEIANTVNDSISKAVNELQQLQATREFGQDIAKQQTELVKLFTVVFETAGLTNLYSATDIERFVKILLSSTGKDIKNIDPILKLVDYSFSSLGTHEGRRYLLSNPVQLRIFRESLHAALGRVTLLSPRVNSRHQMPVAA